MADMERLALVWNPNAAGGRARRALKQALAELTRLGAELRIVRTRSLEHAAEEARAAAMTGETVVAVGGDGLVGCLSGALRHAGRLAIIPAGRGNDFARSLGVPLRPRPAARVAVEGSERHVDVGLANGHPFVGILSIGLDAEASEIAARTRVVPGRFVYLYAGMLALVRWRHQTFDITVDGVEQTMTGYAVSVANSHTYAGGMRLAPEAKLDDGVLDVVTVARCSRLHIARLMPRVFRGKHVDDPIVGFLAGTQVDVRVRDGEGSRNLPVCADGERITELPVSVIVDPRSLCVRVP
jgi:YegS/Rv2252/BmrU family lipid kinase